MVQGTTPIHTFILPFQVSLVKKCNIVYAQNGKVILKKRETDCERSEKALHLRLKQEETGLFDSRSSVSVQMHLLTVSGEAFVSREYTVTVKACLDDEVLE